MNRKFGTKWFKLAPIVLAVLLAVAPLRAFADDPPHYEAANTVYSGSLLYDIEFSDLDKDGNLDMIVMHHVDNTIVILLGNGDGTFKAPETIPVGDNPRGAAVDDFNLDGIHDIAVNNYVGNSVSVLLGNGDGTFQTAVTYPSGNGSLDVISADLNGDGKPDLAVTNDLSNEISVLYGNGDGTFAAPVAHSVGVLPRFLLPGDFNGDGKTDLVNVNDGANTISVLLGDGSGGFARQDYAAGATPFVFTAGDWNRDNVTDLAITANGGHGMTILLGNDDGSFQAPVLYITGAATYPLYISDGDFNGDGLSDLVVTNQSVGYYSMFLGNGNGTFQPELRYATVSARPIKGGDFNNDGISDVIINKVTPSQIEVLLSKSEGTVSLDSASYSTAENNGSVVVQIERSDSYGPTKVQLTTSDGSAVAGADYTAVTATVSFAMGETTKTYSIPTLDNAVYSGNRTFTVTLSSPTNGVTLGAQASATITILEDEPAPDTTAPVVDASKFSAVDNYAGTPDRIIGAAGAVSESGAIVRAYLWDDADADSTVDAGELSAVGVVLGTSAADGSVPAADLGDLPPGTYRYVITATDAAGNESPRAANAAVTVGLTKAAMSKPVIHLNGANPLTIPVGSPFTDPGASVEDAVYGDLSASLTVTGSVYTGTPGDYTLRYNVQNPAGIWADEAIRIVKVTTATAPEGSGGSTAIQRASVKINGVSQWVNASYEMTGGQRITRIFPTVGQLTEAFANVPDGIRIEAQNIGEAVKMDLPVAPLLHALKLHPDAVVEWGVNGNALHIPLGILQDLPEQATVSAMIAAVTDSDSTDWNDAIARVGGEPMLAHPVFYSLRMSDGTGIDWGRAYAIRTAALPEPADPDQAAAVRIDENGSIRFVPSVIANDGSLLVTIRSPYDGVYSVIRLDHSFADLDGHWAQKDIVLLANKLLIEGRTQDRFVPDENITRAEFASLLVRALGLADEGNGPPPFLDVAPRAWYAGVVSAAYQALIIDGFEDGTFRPADPITREQMAVMIVRAMDYAGYEPGATEAKAKSFADDADIAPWAEAAVDRLTAASIIQGLTETEFGPQSFATRAQSTVLLKRMLQALQFINP